MTIARIQPDVFFSPRTELPRGRYALDRDEARAAQRERLMAAFTELVAEHGLAQVTVASVVAHAGVSRVAFYACFDDLAGCGDAAYERFISVLLTRLGRAMELHTDDWHAYYGAAIRAYLDALAADPVVARAMQIEMDAAGKPARVRRQAALSLIAEVLAARHVAYREHDPTLGALPPEATLAIVYGVRQLACDTLDRGVGAELVELADPLLRWVEATVRGYSSTEAEEIRVMMSDEQRT